MTETESHDAATSRLRAEAEFQNRRVSRAAAGMREARDSFYFLAASAHTRYAEALRGLRDKHVLVVGCSVGGVTPLARAGAHVVGIDISEDAVSQHRRSIARENLQAFASVQLMDAENLEFAPYSFDLICCSGVLHHLHVERAARTWARVLKPTGSVVMLEPMAWHPVVAAFRLLTPSLRTKDEHPLKPRDFHLLGEFFEDVQVEAFVLFSIAAAMLGRWDRTGSLRERVRLVLESLDARLLRLFPSLKYFCWTAVIRLSRPRRQVDSETASTAGTPDLSGSMPRLYRSSPPRGRSGRNFPLE
jgi:SAM-dependent methyltransferase